MSVQSPQSRGVPDVLYIFIRYHAFLGFSSGGYGPTVPVYETNAVGVRPCTGYRRRSLCFIYNNQRIVYKIPLMRGGRACYNNLYVQNLPWRYFQNTDFLSQIINLVPDHGGTERDVVSDRRLNGPIICIFCFIIQYTIPSIFERNYRHAPT